MVRTTFAGLMIWAALGLGSVAFAEDAESSGAAPAARGNNASAGQSSSNNGQNTGGGYYYYRPQYYYRGSGILDRPNRPGHPVGNTIRALFGRG